MHHQFYGCEEEFEPRVTPKPVTKLECLTIPSVPEISLIFEKPAARNLSDGSTNLLSAETLPRLTKTVQFPDNIVKCNSSALPILDKYNSYAEWREQNYCRENNSANTVRHISPCKNIYSHNHVAQPCLQDASIQSQQRQDKICDTQSKLINARYNDGIYEKSVKFKCSDMGNSHDPIREKDLSSSYEKQLSYNSLQATPCMTNYTKRVPSDAIPSPRNETEYRSDAAYPHSNTDINEYPFQQYHTSRYSNCYTDNNETVKTLVQLVNSQSEQIKNLQLQVEKLVRMQEESFRNKSACMCSPLSATQTCRHSLVNCYDTTHDSYRAHEADIQNIKKNRNQTSTMEKGDSKNFENEDSNKLETALLEQQPKKSFMEQKVSIGVMTSFEFTVQNSPLLIDSEIYNKREAQKDCNATNRRNTVTSHDTIESVKKYRNPFTCKTGTAQLENIVEDTESYLSSSQQQSSNFYAGSSVKGSEKHACVHIPKESNLYNVTKALVSSKMDQRFSTNLNGEKISEGIYVKRSGKIDEQMQNTRKISNASVDIDCSPVQNKNCSKALIVNDRNDYTVLNGEKSNDNANVNRHSMSNAPVTNCYNHMNKEHAVNIKAINSIGDSMVLNEGDLKVLERPPPTPEPSIHVEMQEYSSDDESDKLKRTSKIGWTFYNNVLGQVNEILQNSSIKDKQGQNNVKITHNLEKENDTEGRMALKTVKTATLEQLRRLGISLTENNEHGESNNRTSDFDTSFYPRLECQANMMHATSVVNETNTSMHMKALALKYLSDEQLADIALHKQGTSSLQHLMLSNMQGTNMSFATMRYLERYQLLPGGKNNDQMGDTKKICDEFTSKQDIKSTSVKNNPAIHQFPFVQTPRTTCPSKILDISTLKQQPKLL